MAGRKPRVSDSEILEVFAASSDPVLSAKEVSEEIDIGERGTYQRLEELRDRNLVEDKKIGQARAWWITDAGRDFLSGDLDADELE